MLQLFLDAVETRQFLTHLGHPARDSLALCSANAFCLALILQSLLILALKHQNQLVLQLLHRLVDLVEPHELGLCAGQLAFELLDASGLLDDLRGLALDTLLQFSDFPAVTAVFFVEPGDHLGELICIHTLSSRAKV